MMLDEGTGYGRPVGSHDAALTEVGPITPMGELMRRYWHPVGLTSDAGSTPKAVRVLGEDLVLFRDGAGRPGLLHSRCCHRGTTLYFAKVEPEGIRCCYHGWKFDFEGRCLDQPCEPKGGIAKANYRQPWYPVQERYGLIFAYLGSSQNKPLLPRYECFEDLAPDEVLDADDTSIGGGGPPVIGCNWLQNVENIVDPMHVPILHMSHSGPQFNDMKETVPDHTTFERTPTGVKYHTSTALADGSEYVMEGEIAFPTIRVVPNPFFTPTADDPIVGIDSLGWIVPIDDVHYRIYTVSRYPNAAMAAHVRKFMESFSEKRSAQTPEHRRAFPGDYEAQTGQGTISLHSDEHLVSSDRGVALFRRVLREQMEAVKNGKPPLGVSFEVADPPMAFGAFRGLKFQQTVAKEESPASAATRRARIIDLDGEWECVTKTPMGEQMTVLTLLRDADTFTGASTGADEKVEIQEGRVAGSAITWHLSLKKPFPMKLTCKAQIDGDTFSGSVEAGMFGSSPMTGRRRS